MRGILNLFAASIIGLGGLADSALASGKPGSTAYRPAPRVIVQPKIVVPPRVHIAPRIIHDKAPGIIKAPVTVGPKTVIVPTIASPRLHTGPGADVRFGAWTSGRWFGRDCHRIWDPRLGCFLYRFVGRVGCYRYAEDRGCFTPIGMPEGLPPGPEGCPLTTPPMGSPPMDVPMDPPMDGTPMDDAPVDPATPEAPDESGTPLPGDE